MNIKKSIDNLNRSAVMAVLAGAMVITPVALFAQVSNADTGTSQAAVTAPVGSSIDVQINNKGEATVHGAKITAISGSTITATTQWGSATLTWTVNTNGNTKLLRRYDGASSLSEMTAGDYINFNGMLDQSQGNLVVTASVVRDNSIQKVNATVTGSVTAIASTSNSFTLATKERGNVTVNVGSTTITKGGVAIAFSQLMVGDKLTATGIYDNNSHVLAASKITVTPPAILKQHTFEGKLNAAVGTTSLPTSFTLMVGSTNYTINVPVGAAVLTKNWAPTNLGSYQSGDTVRVYGQVEAANLSVIDAVVVRDATR